MSGTLKRFVFLAGLWTTLASVAWGQSHFMYIQSENGTPFYVKMNDSLISSTSSGYLIMHNMKKGTYPVVIGFAKQKVPEAAFQLSVGDSGDRGYTLKSVGGKLRLTDIQTRQVVQAVEVATSAGNRILPSTIAEIGQAPPADQPGQQPLETAGNPALPAADTAPVEAAATDQTTAPRDDAFENMLNAVTGSGTAEPAPAEDAGTPPTDQGAVAADPVAGSGEKNSPPVTEPQKDSNPFTDLLNQEPESAPPTESAPVASSPTDPLETTAVDAAKNPVAAAPAPDLTFIDFGDSSQKAEEPMVLAATPAKAAEDTLITSGKALRQWKREQRRTVRNQGEKESSSLFDDLMRKVDTVATDSSAATSVAYPLFGNNGSRNRVVAESPQEGSSAADGDAVLCNEVADADYFSKVLRKTASKKSQEAMLRTATRDLSSGRCYTTSQIKQWAYQFASDDSRLAFLKAAYRHCADKAHYASLVSVLSDAGSQNQLKAFIP